MSMHAKIVAVAALVVGLRLVVLALTPTDLYLDEAQYWAWGANPDFGYFSKPPLIGWVIRVVTELAGSIEPFWVRFAAPLFHGVTGVILGFWMLRAAPKAALWATALYLSMPILTVGSWLISTDTIMAPAFAAALWSWWSYLQKPRPQLAILTGLLVGVAMMAKYAGVYFWLGAAVAALSPALRPRPRDVALALLACLLVMSPNILWNIQNGLTTVSHTMDNADWVKADKGAQYNFRGVAEFLGAQLLVIGPLFFLTWMGTLRAARKPDIWFFLAFSLPVLALVTTQAFLSKAFANWAFAAYLAAAPLVALWLVEQNRLRWLKWGLAVNVAISLTVTALILKPDLAPGATKRYVDRATVAQRILDEAQGLPVVAQERGLLADLTYQAARQNYPGAILSLRGPGPVHHYYEMQFPWTVQGEAVLVSTGGLPACLTSGTQPSTSFRADTGAHAGTTFRLYPLSGPCARH